MPEAGGRRSVDAASGYDPLGSLSRDLGDEVEVVVVVQDDELLDVGDRCQDQVRDADSTMLAAADQQRLHLAGPLLGTNRHRDREQMVQDVVVSEILCCGREAPERVAVDVLATLGGTHRLVQRSVDGVLDRVGAEDQLGSVERAVIDVHQPFRQGRLSRAEMAMATIPTAVRAPAAWMDSGMSSSVERPQTFHTASTMA